MEKKQLGETPCQQPTPAPPIQCWLSAWRSCAQAAASKNSHLNIEWGGWGGGSSRHGRKNCATTFFIGLTAKKKRVFLFKKKVTDKTKRHRFS